VTLVEADELTRELRALYEEWFAAVARRDVGHLDARMHDRWEYTDATGAVRSKQEYLRTIATGPGDFSLEIAGFRAIPVPAGAVIRAIWLTRAERLEPRAELVSTTNHTGVWISTDAGWRSLVHHVTTVTDGALRSGHSIG
jgi:hypothetical protein